MVSPATVEEGLTLDNIVLPPPPPLPVAEDAYIQMIELWTKRKFKCDCGNSKFGESYCKLLPSKDLENGENSYNQNFKGKYCTCGRPYPDSDAEEQVEMIRCCLCEDWFHEEHLGLDSTNKLQIPRDEEGKQLYEYLI